MPRTTRLAQEDCQQARHQFSCLLEGLHQEDRPLHRSEPARIEYSRSIGLGPQPSQQTQVRLSRIEDLRVNPIAYDMDPLPLQAVKLDKLS